jgi:cell division protein FtsQ
MFILRLFMLACLLIAAWGSTNMSMGAPIIKTPLSPSERADIEHALSQIGAPAFLSFSPKRIQDALAEIPWLADAHAYREFPLRWHLSLKRTVPVALWKNQFYLDDRGRILNLSQMTSVQQLPNLGGADELAAQVLRHYLDFQSILAPHRALSIQTMHLERRTEWHIMTLDGISIRLPYVQGRERLLRFARAYSQLSNPAHKKIRSVNMHYVNGMAIEWCAPANSHCQHKGV